MKSPKKPKSWEMQSFFIVKSKDDSGIDPRIVAYHDETSPIAEEYKILRTNIKSHFMRLERKRRIPHSPEARRRPKIITVTSSVPTEGKSISSTNLAITLAKELDSHVLLLDCDLRGGTIHRLLGRQAEGGMTELIQGDLTLEDAIQTSSMPQMDVILRGGIPINPSELLGSHSMEQILKMLKGYPYNYIIVDTPPILSYTDAGILASLSDGVIFVVQAFKTPNHIVRKSKELLESAQARILGFMLTQTDYFISQYYGYHSYYYYSKKPKE